ncbi:hypothetical protein O6H91_05G114400 [Diphasiastrum complanatum]|uniref:Uncharacterized protein n=1 Tax=Diphasiastrum complanatum TaxID=34168 RepID=A0ACC2DSU2_DIPCM|nr:hypothetical protein O6H91_05G114400 [Diphasiastrum complanatum]
MWSIPRLVVLPICIVFLMLLVQFYLPNSNQVVSNSADTIVSLDQTRGAPINSVLTDRGASLLHCWTDRELFKRAVSAATSAIHAYPPSFDKHERSVDWLQGHRFRSNWPNIFSSLHSKLGCVSTVCSENGVAESKSPPKPKIAFLFLIRSSLPFAPLWIRFFHGHENLYNIYVHADPSGGLSLLDRSVGIFWGRLIPSQKTERANPSLISAQRRLLANALLDDPLNEYFAIISDHCIPLYSFSNIYKKLTSSRISFLEVLDHSRTLSNRYIARGKNVMLPEVPFQDFKVGSQFFIITKKHALMYVKDQKYWNKFKLKCKDTNSCFPEEHYFSTVMYIEDRNGTTSFTRTYVNWASPTKGGHPKTYTRLETDQTLINNIRLQKDGRFLFARKFDDDCLEKFLELADYMFQD